MPLVPSDRPVSPLAAGVAARPGAAKPAAAVEAVFSGPAPRPAPAWGDDEDLGPTWDSAPAGALVYPPTLKTYTEKHHSYPDRFAVEPGQRAWTVACPGYRPPYPKFEELAGQPWRMPERASLEDAPKNPAGRTGIQGRGILGAWGANHAADPIITRTDPRSGGLLVLLVERGDSGELALPGGMVDPGERLSVTAARELQEETGLTIDMTDATPVHEGFVDDPRNTDHAWMETKVFHKHLDADTSSAIRGAPLQSRDAAETRGVRWVPVEEALTGIMYANHADLLRLALGRP